MTAPASAQAGVPDREPALPGWPMRRALPLALLTLTLGCDGLRAVVIDNYPTAYSAEAGAAVRRTTPGAIDGPDLARLQLSAPEAPGFRS